jgi:hypothetical protein
MAFTAADFAAALHHRLVLAQARHGRVWCFARIAVAVGTTLVALTVLGLIESALATN